MARSQSSTTVTSGPRRAYVVLGMHRSGTSAVTQFLALAGASLPQNVMPGDEHNAKGYFEPWKLALLNDERQRAGGSAWDDPFAFPYRPLPPKDEAAWIARGVAVFAEEYAGAEIPLLKDPRVSVLLPMWREVLKQSQAQAACVIPVRHPLAVAGSLTRRDGFAVEKSVLLWTAYMLASEAYSRDLPRAVIGYDQLLADWRVQAARIEAAHGAPLPALTDSAAKEIDAFLTADLRHNTGADSLDDLGWIGALATQVLDWFEAAARDEQPDPAVLDAVGAEFARRRDEIGVLVSPPTRDLDVMRAELRTTRERLAYVEGAQAQAFAEERTALEEGWRTDVANLTDQLKAETAEVKAGWEADVAQLTAEAATIQANWEADVAKLTEQLKRETAELKAAWEADVAQLTAEAAKIQANWEVDVAKLTDQLKRETAELRANWEADVAQLTAEAATIKSNWQADVAQLTSESASTKANWEADVKRLTQQISQETAARQTELDVIALAEAELDRILKNA